MAIYLKVLGCRLNQAEADGWDGVTLTARPEDAGLAVLHGCAVTARSERKARQLLYRWRRLPGARRLAVTGCLARHWLATGGAPDGVELVARGWPVPPAESGSAAVTPPAGRTRRTLKLQDGCTHRCTYCIVPSLRPGQWHAEPAAALAQVGRWLADGVKEIVVSGLHLGSYRFGGWNLARWLQAALALPGEFRLRLSSLEPHAIDDELLALLAAAAPRLCPHLHLPVQSGADAVLRRMNRPYDRAQLDVLTGRIRRLLPDAALTVDCIVGFPGETAADFAATLDLVRRLDCARAHVFPFSPRPGTPAALFADRVPSGIAQARVAELYGVVAATAHAYRARFTGRTVTVLTEKTRSGYSENYLPVTLDRDCPGNTLVRARVSGVTADGLAAIVLADTASTAGDNG
ncbi:MAG TPA: radical SAM protein [bacterium]|nr:radical SAM protein [bacterium]